VVDGAHRTHRLEDGTGQRGQVPRIQFVQVEAVRLPVFVQADRHVPGRERGQPLKMQLHLGGPGGSVVAVQVEARGVFARAQLAALGVEARANP